MNEPGDHHHENQTTDRSTTNRNDVDSGPWFDPDELTPRSLWEKIGDGSFGKVYRAHLLGTAVAVKVIQNLKPDRVAGLKRDIFYLSRMTHPNVVPIYGAFIEEGMLHMVMEFVPNSLRNKRVVNQVNVVRVLQDVARALVRMHAQGHIHRDVKARNVLISADFETAKLTDFGLARILPQYANDRRDVNPKTTPKIGPPKYRAPEVERHDSEKDHTYAFSSDVYGYGVMCFQLIDQVKKRRRKSHPHEVDFVTGLGNACCEEDPRARPTAAMCLAKCREFLGESWTANDRVWGNPNPTERVGYWTTEMMDVGTFKKVAPKEEEEGKDSPSGLEHGETPTTTNGRTQTRGKRGKHSDDEDEDDDDDDDDDEENQQINKNKKAKERELIKMLEDERRMGGKGTTTTAPAAVQAAVQAVADAENRNGTNTNGTGTPTTTTSLRRRVIEAHGNTNNTNNNGAKANRKRSKPATGDAMDIGVNAHAAGIENTQVAMVRSADGRITKTSSLGEDSGSQTPVSKYSRGENVASENGPPVVRRLNSLSTLGMGDLKVEETRS
ncbi:unnamed protein product [Bathycoccus prasinos]